MSLRKLLFWGHLGVGVAAGVVILIMSVTGVLLTYQRQILAKSARGLQTAAVAARPGGWLPVRTLADAVTTAQNGERPISLQFARDRAMPVAAEYPKARTIYLDGRSAQVLGEADPKLKKLFNDIIQWHRWLGRTGESRTTAKTVFDGANLLFLLLVLSGLILWIPRPFTRQRAKAVALTRRGLRGKARDFNWHNVAGLWFALPLVLIVGSGVVISYGWATNLVYRAVLDTPPPSEPARAGGGGGAAGRGAGAAGAGVTAGANAGAPVGATASLASAVPIAEFPVSLDSALHIAMNHSDEWRTITVPMPKPDAKTIALTIDEGTGGQPQRRQSIYVDLNSAKITDIGGFATQSRGRRLRAWLRWAHTGEAFGVWGQTIAGLASLAGVLLVWTGLTLSWRRLMAFLRRRQRGDAELTPAAL